MLVALPLLCVFALASICEYSDPTVIYSYYCIFIESSVMNSCQSRMIMESSVVFDAQQSTVDYKFCSQPVRKGKVNFPESLIGRAKATGMEMYSGYINITSAPDYLFYWFFGSQDGNSSAPLIIWTNGGPGCTAMEGATTEHGPLALFSIKESCSESSGKCDYTNQLSSNPYAWNKHSNVLYVDQPRNVGYSFGYGKGSTSSVEAANDFVVFFNEWLTEFPQFVGRPVIIAGESYGGHYIPAWADAILNYNANPSTRTRINFSGAIIGNGCVDDKVQNTETFVSFQHAENLIPTTSNPTTATAARTAMTKNLGYTPNYYDYRIQSISCSACYGYDYTAWSAWFLRDDVKSALNICGEAGNDAFAGSAGGCISLPGFDSKDTFDYSGALARTLDAGVPVTLYYGKSDTACDYKGGFSMASGLPWKGASGFKASTMRDLNVAGVSVGQVKAYDGLTFVQVESAGHMVPMDQPAAAYFAIDTLLASI